MDKCPGCTDMPRRVQHMREASQEDSLASPRHFFAPKNVHDQAILIRFPEEAPIIATGGATIETPTLTTTSTVLTTSTTTTAADVGMRILVFFLLMALLLDLLQQLPVGHEHGY